MRQTNGMPASGDGSLWYKDAIIYQVHVKAFFDSNDNGIGDFRGLTEKLDYVRDLGVNTIWLLPFYPSPLKDDGYDIADYRNIHPDYGSRGDFRAFLREAHRRGLRVITELVINHTSDQHPWFQAARKAAAGSNKRNYYVWSDTCHKWEDTRIIFTDTESSNWAWDPVAGAYYWHRFFSHQPDLNFNNPSVIRTVMRVMRFWFDLGVDGMRLDAIPYLCERDGTLNENLPETHAVLKYMRAELDNHYRDRMFLAEANQWPEDVSEYFGDSDECHMAYHFPLMPRMYMALAQEDRYPIVEIMQQTPEIPESCQWAVFLRNHDELTLEMVTHQERDYMYRVYATDQRMRVNVGIRRRLAPLMGNDPDKIKLMNSLLLSMPGSPIIYYGDEIGMGDNVYLGDRNGVRTPMQWSPDRNGGFSKADPQRLYLPVIMDPVYGFQAVNVEAQARNPASLLNWMKRIIEVRKNYRAFGRGSLEFLAPGNRRILAYLREHEDETLLCVANLSHTAQPVELNLSRYRGRVPLELMGRTAFPPVGELPYLLTLPGYGFQWFRLAADVEAPRWHLERASLAELPVLVLVEGLGTFFAHEPGQRDARKLLARRTRTQLERDILPAFLSMQTWFGPKDRPLDRVALAEHKEWALDSGSWLLSMVQTECRGIEPRTWFVPLAVRWEESQSDEWARVIAPLTLSRVRQRARMGLLHDALADEGFCWAVVKSMGAGRGEGMDWPYPGGKLHFSCTGAFERIVEGVSHRIRQEVFEESNTSVVIGDKLLLKCYRQVQPGIHHELEVGRFLTDVSPFPPIAPVAGAMEYLRSDGSTATLALLTEYVDNQGDAWSYTLDYLQRYIESVKGAPGGAGELASPIPEELFMARMETLGRRIGDLHGALARKTGDPAFEPEPAGLEDIARWKEAVREEGVRMFNLLEQRLTGLDGRVRQAAERLLARRARLLSWIEAVDLTGLPAMKTRYHGDLKLERALLTQNDFVLTGFEGDTALPFGERRTKHSPLRDVASMLHSLNRAGHTALARFAVERYEERERLHSPVQSWLQGAIRVFLDGYGHARGGHNAEPTPGTPDHKNYHPLIDLFVLERALRELGNELIAEPGFHGEDVEISLNRVLELSGA